MLCQFLNCSEQRHIAVLQRGPAGSSARSFSRRAREKAVTIPHLGMFFVW